jgi:hypothetical protein
MSSNQDSTLLNRRGGDKSAPPAHISLHNWQGGVVHRQLLADRSDTAVGDAHLHGVARIDPRRQTEPCVDRQQDLNRLHRHPA